LSQSAGKRLGWHGVRERKWLFASRVVPAVENGTGNLALTAGCSRSIAASSCVARFHHPAKLTLCRLDAYSGVEGLKVTVL